MYSLLPSPNDQQQHRAKRLQQNNHHQTPYMHSKNVCISAQKNTNTTMLMLKPQLPPLCSLCSALLCNISSCAMVFALYSYTAFYTNLFVCFQPRKNHRKPQANMHHERPLYMYMYTHCLIESSVLLSLRCWHKYMLDHQSMVCVQ